MRFPETLLYTKDHEWAKIDGKIATIGITDHAQSALGDIVFCELPKSGREVKEHETFGVVESIKAVSDLYSPFAGRISDVNKAVIDEPAKINADPHASAWMIKIELADPAAATKLMSAADYTKYVESLK